MARPVINLLKLARRRLGLALFLITTVLFLTALAGWLALSFRHHPLWRELAERGRSAASHGQTAQALELYGQALLQDNKAPGLKEETAALYTSYGLELQRDQNQQDTAELQFQKALLLEPEYEPAYYNLGLAFAARKAYEEAVEAFKQALRLKPDRAGTASQLASAELNLGSVWAAKNRWGAAITHYAQALHYNPNYKEAIDALTTTGEKIKALEEKQKQLENNVRKQAALWQKNPADAALRLQLANAHNLLGLLLRDKGDYGPAVTEFKETLQVEPNFWPGYFNLGLITDERGGKLEKALQYYRDAHRLNPDYAPARYCISHTLGRLGGLLAAQNKFADAEQLLREACSTDPSYWLPQHNLGCALSGLGKPEEAIIAYNAALRLKPDSILTKAKLAEAIRATGERVGGPAGERK